MDKVTINIDGVEYIRADVSASVDGLRYAIVRSHDQGVMSGFVKAIEGRMVTLVRARQLWRWCSEFVLVELADGRGARDKCRFSAESVDEVVLLEACGVLYCSSAGAAFLQSVVAEVHAC